MPVLALSNRVVGAATGRRYALAGVAKTVLFAITGVTGPGPPVTSGPGQLVLGVLRCSCHSEPGLTGWLGSLGRREL